MDRKCRCLTTHATSVSSVVEHSAYTCCTLRRVRRHTMECYFRKLHDYRGTLWSRVRYPYGGSFCCFGFCSGFCPTEIELSGFYLNWYSCASSKQSGQVGRCVPVHKRAKSAAGEVSGQRRYFRGGYARSGARFSAVSAPSWRTVACTTQLSCCVWTVRFSALEPRGSVDVGIVARPRRVHR